MKAVLMIAALLASNAAAAAGEPFLVTAAQGDATEVKMGALAHSHGSSPKVLDFGETLIRDHGAHLTKVKALAKTEGVALPAGISDAQKADYAKLAPLMGGDFDKAFKEHMVMDHEKDIAAYQAAANGDNPRLAAFAKETLPTLEAHLAAAKAL